jgi:hypothetical protein
MNWNFGTGYFPISEKRERAESQFLIRPGDRKEMIT